MSGISARGEGCAFRAGGNDTSRPASGRWGASHSPESLLWVNLAEASLYSETYHCDAIAFSSANTRAYAKKAIRKLLGVDLNFGNVWAGYLAHELQGARLRAEVLSLRTVAERLDAWTEWNGGAIPQKGEWKLVADQIGVSPEALYREFAKNRRAY